MPADQVAQLGAYYGIDQTWFEMAATALNLSGELFRLMADRPAALAVGMEHRNEFGGTRKNPIQAIGWDGDDGQPSLPTAGHFYVNEFYGELVLPIVNNTDFAEDLELQAAIRGFDYNTFGGGATYKFGVRWMPIRDVTIRGTFSTGFRAPSISELFPGNAVSYEAASDPCADLDPVKSPQLAAQCGKAVNNGFTDPQTKLTVGGNVNLQPEKANIATAGLVFQPTFVRGLSATFDYYYVSMTQNISTISTAVILNKCYPGADANGNPIAPDAQSCSLITRDPATQQIINVQDTNQNVGTVVTSGMDLSVAYSMPTDDFGKFAFRLAGTYLIQYDLTQADGTFIPGAGNYDLGLNPRIKGNASISWLYDQVYASLIGRFIGPSKECAGPDGTSSSGSLCYLNFGPADDQGNQTGIYPSRTISANMTFDLLVSYKLKSPVGTSTLSVGVRNLLNTDPPFIYSNTTLFTDAAYDFVGRYMYARIDHRF
jgi:iron complex outermembrane receptor protein